MPPGETRIGLGMTKSRSLMFVPRPAIALDLDDTLIRSSLLKPKDKEFFTVRVGRRRIYIQVRPGLETFLKKVQKHYDVFIFSASHSEYGNQIIDQIAPDIASCRRFFKDSCVCEAGYSVKDLSILRRPLTKTILVDDMAGSGMRNPDNLIKIEPWNGNREDSVLVKELLPLLENIVMENDMTEGVRQAMLRHSYANLSLFPYV